MAKGCLCVTLGPRWGSCVEVRSDRGIGWSSRDCGIRSCQDRSMAQHEPRFPEYRLGDAVLETMRGALRILGGTVQMAVGMTRMLAGAVLKVAAVAEKAVGASEEDGESFGSVPA